jgi:hypothetical protein
VIERYLRELEHRVDPDTEAALFAQWQAFADGRVETDVFSPRRPKAAPAAVEWPHVLVNDALDDVDAMALQQFEGCSQALAEGSGALLAVRCNYGTAILPSLFGAELFLMDREIDTLPTCRPLAGGVEAVKRLLDAGVPDLEGGQGGQVFRMGRRFGEILEAFPKLSHCVYVFHPDLQGPMNVCEMLWGGTLYVDFYDTPDLIKGFLSLITDTYVAFMQRWREIVPPLDGYGVHWAMLHRGHIMIRDDAATNFSPEMFDEFIRPYDQRLLDTFGGGGVHFCGRGHHFVDKVADMAGVYSVNMTQPEHNDVETIYRHTVDRGVNLIGLDAEAVNQAARSSRPLRGRAHCW